MKLSSAYLADRLQERYEVVGRKKTCGDDEYFRPFLMTRDSVPMKGRVCVLTGAYLKQMQKIAHARKEVCDWSDTLFVLTEWEKEEQAVKELEGPYIKLNASVSAAEVLNTIQRIYDRCDDWVDQLNTLVLQSGSIQRALKLSAEMFENPIVVMGMDFTLTAESRVGGMNAETKLFKDQLVNLEYMNAFIQDETFKK